MVDEIASGKVKISGENTSAKAALSETKAALSALSGVFKQVTGISLSAAGAIGMAGMAIKKLGQFIDDSVKETVAYNKTVREMGQVTGLSADEVSRIIQVADDWGISIDAVSTSLSFMNKTGLTPSIDNLAKLADEYVTTTNKAEFAHKAVATLGRGYTTLIPLLALGGDGFRAAAAGIDASLIATDKGIAASRQYEIALDDLDDTTNGLKYTIGNALLPALSDTLSVWLKLKDVLPDYNNTLGTYYNMVKTGIIPEEEALSIRKQLLNPTLTLTDRQEILTQAVERYNGVMDTAGNKMKTLYDKQGNLITSTENLTVVTGDYTDLIGGRYAIASQAAADRNRDFRGSLDDATIAADNLNIAAGKLKEEGLANLSWELSQPLTQANEGFIQQQDDIKQRMQDIQTEIANDIAGGYKEQSDTIVGLRGDYADLQTQYDDNVTAHDKDTKQIILDLAMQQAAVAGMDDPALFTRIALDWGLITQAEADEMKAAIDATTYLSTHPGDVAGYEAILLGQATLWSTLKGQAIEAGQAVVSYGIGIGNLHDKSITITTDYVDNYTTHHPGEDYPVYQYGANFIVPPGYPNDSYRMNVESGEHVIVQPANTTNNSFNVNLTGSGQPSQDLLSTVRLLNQLYG